MASSDKVFCWVNKTDTIGVPVGAVARDCSPEGSRNYVVLANHNNFFIAGNYQEGNNYAEYELLRCEYAADWKYLVSNEDVTGMGIIQIIVTVIDFKIYRLLLNFSFMSLSTIGPSGSGAILYRYHESDCNVSGFQENCFSATMTKILETYVMTG